MPTTPRAHRAAFSLVEVVMVVAIVSILSAIAIPRFSSAERRHRADAAAQRMVADFEYIRQTARAQAASYTVSFSLLLNAYASSARPLDVGPDNPYIVYLDRPPYRARLVRVELDTSSLAFDGYGMPNTHAQITLAVGSVTRVVTIDADTGEIAIQ